MQRMILIVGLLISTSCFAQGDERQRFERVSLPALQQPAWVIRDDVGIAHVYAANERDLFFLQGYVHAQDRLFQMDTSRRRASGDLAELLGPGVVQDDVFFRTIGLRRAAKRSLAAFPEQTRQITQAYADGVNAYVAGHALPLEYGALELTQFRQWTPLDSIVVSKLVAFSLSFDAGDIQRTVALSAYRQGGALAGFDGNALFFEDIFRAAPFDPAATVPDARRTQPASASIVKTQSHLPFDPEAAELGRRFLKRLQTTPDLHRLLDERRARGSNEWAISPSLSKSGYALLANDPHLSLEAPSVFYPIHLKRGSLDVMGNSFAGVPSVILGFNRHIAWGATVNRMDVVDYYKEQIRPDAQSPSGLSTVYQGALEPILAIPEVFFTNTPGDAVMDNLTRLPAGNGIPAATLVVPRRNNGPIIELDLASGAGLSVQYTGFGPTQELQTFLDWNRASTLDEFKRGLDSFDFGSQNIVYADTGGNIAYFTTGELPLREDLQAGTVNGLPPFFIRNGGGGNEWISAAHEQPTRANPYVMLSAAEMPQIVNPAQGWFVNANNDPVGVSLDNQPLNTLRADGGIYYLHYNFQGGFRAGRITQQIRQRLKASDKGLSLRDMQKIQADNRLPDAVIFTPYIIEAMKHAERVDADPQLAAFAANAGLREAVARLRAWDYSSPSGIQGNTKLRALRDDEDEGDDDDAHDDTRGDNEANASVAATLYSVWRGQFLRRVIDARLQPMGLPLPPDQEALAALRHVLEQFDERQGVGASGLDFFALEGVASPADRRDIMVLQSLDDALQRLSGEPFAAAFHYSLNQDDYRWGRLHRIVFAHPLGGQFSIPPAGGAFPAPLPDLAGIPTDGGFQTVDAASHDVRAQSAQAFMFSAGPANRFVAELRPGRVHAESIWPGGVSGELGKANYTNQLPLWLRNDSVKLSTRLSDLLRRGTQSMVYYRP